MRRDSFMRWLGCRFSLERIIRGPKVGFEEVTICFLEFVQSRDGRSHHALGACPEGRLRDPEGRLNAAQGEEQVAGVQVPFGEWIRLDQVDGERDECIESALLGDNEAVILRCEFTQRYLSELANTLDHRRGIIGVGPVRAFEIVECCVDIHLTNQRGSLTNRA